MSALTHRAGRVVAARRLARRADRVAAGRFLVEGAPSVREALAAARSGSCVVHEVFASRPDGELERAAAAAGVTVTPITDRAAQLLSHTVTTQGVFAVCDLLTGTLDDALSRPPRQPRLVAVGISTADPGNAGTIIRVADAAGADAVIFAGDAVDPHNAKCVRASAGSVFHLPIACGADTAEVTDVVTACRAVGLRVLVADGHARLELGALELGAPTAWLFGNEAHGVDDTVLALADDTVRVPIYGVAESLNVATAAAICLYASAMAAKSAGPVTPAGAVRP